MQNALRLPLNTMSLPLFRATIHASQVSTATHLHSERKRVEGKTLSNKTPGSLRSDRCSALSKSVTGSVERSFQDFGEKPSHSQVVQEVEFAVVGIGIALLRSHA